MKFDSLSLWDTKFVELTQGSSIWLLSIVKWSVTAYMLMPVVFKLHMIKKDCNFYEVKADFRFRFLEESV